VCDLETSRMGAPYIYIYIYIYDISSLRVKFFGDQQIFPSHIYLFSDAYSKNCAGQKCCGRRVTVLLLSYLWFCLSWHTVFKFGRSLTGIVHYNEAVR